MTHSFALATTLSRLGNLLISYKLLQMTNNGGFGGLAPHLEDLGRAELSSVPGGFFNQEKGVVHVIDARVRRTAPR